MHPNKCQVFQRGLYGCQEWPESQELQLEDILLSCPFMWVQTIMNKMNSSSIFPSFVALTFIIIRWSSRSKGSIKEQWIHSQFLPKIKVVDFILIVSVLHQWYEDRRLLQHDSSLLSCLRVSWRCSLGLWGKFLQGKRTHGDLLEHNPFCANPKGTRI